MPAYQPCPPRPTVEQRREVYRLAAELKTPRMLAVCLAAAAAVGHSPESLEMAEMVTRCLVSGSSPEELREIATGPAVEACLGAHTVAAIHAYIARLEQFRAAGGKV